MYRFLCYSMNSWNSFRTSVDAPAIVQQTSTNIKSCPQAGSLQTRHSCPKSGALVGSVLHTGFSHIFDCRLSSFVYLNLLAQCASLR